MPSPSLRPLSRRAFLGSGLACAGAAVIGSSHPAHAATALLNLSYDPTRELYHEINPAFSSHWNPGRNGGSVVVRTSNGGSGAQARAVLEGAPADIVSLGLARDIDMLALKGLIAPDWQKRLPHNSTPFNSTIVFLVRKGNPKAIHDWPDLVRDTVKVVTPNPKTSGGARWNYLAAWGWALHRQGGTEANARQYLDALFRHVPVLDTGARGATTSFVQRGMGDVLIAWENETLLAARDLGPDQFDIVVPSLSILAEPPVALVDHNARTHGTTAVAQRYLEFLYTPEAQTIATKHYFRPTDAAVAGAGTHLFPAVKTFDIASLGGWADVQKKHFAPGGIFDQMYAPHG
ncbi:sulfate ABC transporter substrate-binding protein [Acetobacter conturbans]|uniref:Sulfate ABC transporter substrate-binding protein n=1 Tax=Acetobacter conturbans TaxID=1737472 RepID=A0ABX0K0A5_9PROT|nr:sulfate ABC transporter substrate-binding protein [Acetobacter conturbans]NHN88572.1 sulfate ABC transporter substrate-binding protein [Acetobacter conturbans]